MDWIKCSDKMPEEHDSIFAKFKGTDKWRPAMFEKASEDVRIVEVFEDGTRRVYHSRTIDGKWDIEKQPMKRTVTHRMPNPELPDDSPTCWQQAKQSGPIRWDDNGDMTGAPEIISMKKLEIQKVDFSRVVSQ